jgi:hypothetical protein
MSQEDVQLEKCRFSKKQIMWGLVAIFAVYGTVSFSVQTMIIARPKITADLDGLSLYAWSVSIPALVMALVTILFGKFSDMYGRRIMLTISLIAALIGAVLSALSPNFIFLIVSSTIGALDDPQVLLSGSAMEDLQKTFQDKDGNSLQLFQKTVWAIRYSLEAGIRNIFWISAITTFLSFLIICTIPRNYISNEE